MVQSPCAKIDDVIHRATARFNVLRPTATFTSVSTTAIPPVVVRTTATGTILLYCGTFASPSLKWTGTVTAPEGGGGSIATTQLVDTIRTVTDGGGTVTTVTSNGTDVSDDHPNEEINGGYVNDDSFQNIAASATQICAAEDHPSQEAAADCIGISAKDGFKNYRMYRPTGDGNIWVTLSRMEWEWAGSASLNATTKKWQMDSSTPPPHNPSGVDTTELPEWTNYFTNLKPQ